MRPAYSLWVLLLATLLLSACTSEDNNQVESQTQQYFFLESLQRIEQAGQILQRSDATQQQLQQAITAMDDGIKLAFQVEARFLDQLDPRLGKNYQRYFIAGVEAYRIGIELRDPEQQRQGLMLLSQWGTFWGAEQASIKARMQPG